MADAETEAELEAEPVAEADAEAEAMLAVLEGCFSMLGEGGKRREMTG